MSTCRNEQANRNYEQMDVKPDWIGQRLDRMLKNSNIGWVSAQKYLRTKKIYVLDQNNE